MKKLLGIVVLGLLYFTINSSHAEDLASWGAIGGNCNDMDKFLKYEEGEVVIIGSIQGFLTGINTQLILDGKDKSVRIINYNSIDFAFNYLEEYCRKNKDGSPVVGLLKYFRTLPIYPD